MKKIFGFLNLGKKENDLENIQKTGEPSIQREEAKIKEKKDIYSDEENHRTNKEAFHTDTTKFKEEDDKMGMKRKKRSSTVYEPFLYQKRVKNKKLTIILLENTEKSIEAKDVISKIIHRIALSDLICVINYGSTVNVGRVCKMIDFDDKKLLDIKCEDDRVCLYDTLKILDKVVTILYKRTQEDDFEKYQINSIDIIGIGSGLDVGSTSSKEDAIKCFDKILDRNIETKYFCFTEDTFIEAASIGFHSIGAFQRI